MEKTACPFRKKSSKWDNKDNQLFVVGKTTQRTNYQTWCVQICTERQKEDEEEEVEKEPSHDPHSLPFEEAAQ